MADLTTLGEDPSFIFHDSPLCKASVSVGVKEQVCVSEGVSVRACRQIGRDLVDR